MTGDGEIDEKGAADPAGFDGGEARWSSDGTSTQTASFGCDGEDQIIWFL